MLDGMERTSSPVPRTRTGKPLQKCYFSRLWEPGPRARTDHAAGAGDAGAPALPRPARNGGDDAVRSRLQPAADRGHPLKAVTVILDLYLARTRALASGDWGLEAFPADGICKPLSPQRRNEKANEVNKISGAPERIRTSDPQIRSLVLYPAELRAPFYCPAILIGWFSSCFWSEWQDLNLRPPRPERGALPDCATLRCRPRGPASGLIAGTFRGRKRLFAVRAVLFAKGSGPRREKNRAGVDADGQAGGRTLPARQAPLSGFRRSRSRGR